jgi:hypothetical protein
MTKKAHGAGAARLVVAGALAAALSACAAQSKFAPAADAQPAPQAYAQPAYAAPASVGGQPAQPAPPPPPPTAEARPSSTPMTPSAPGGGASAVQSRAMAVLGAASELEAAQRELDGTGGDCRNACRALGSMDRAAGRLCELAQGADEGRRCEDARRRVYSARDRVKSTCGACEGGPSVERTAPIPSLR